MTDRCQGQINLKYLEDNSMRNKKKHFLSVVFIFSSGYDASIPNRVLVRSRERAYQPDLTRIEAKID